MSKGFSLVELLVTTAIILILTSLTMPTYRSSNKQLALQRSASKLSQDLRRVQEMAMSTKEVSGSVPYGFGIYFDWLFLNYYILFADLNNNHHRDIGDQDLETIKLESGLRVLTLYPVSVFSIVFSPPDPTVWINDSSSGQTAEISIGKESDPSINQKIIVNNVGLIYVE